MHLCALVLPILVQFWKKDISSGYYRHFRVSLHGEFLHGVFLWFLTGFPLNLYLKINSPGCRFSLVHKYSFGKQEWCCGIKSFIWLPISSFFLLCMLTLFNDFKVTTGFSKINSFSFIFRCIFKITFSLIVNFYLTRTENRSKESLTQLSYYYFE